MSVRCATRAGNLNGTPAASSVRTACARVASGVFIGVVLPEDIGAGVTLAGRYRIEAELARGGESRVFRASELRTGREVALKVLARDPSDKTWAARFRREANLARQLQHPNTVRLLDFDVDADTLPFITYELLPGKTLRTMINKDGALGETRTLRIATQILKSLMESHALGVVHRDIKPENIFVCEFAGETDYVKVLDFGIAKSMESEATVLTSDGMLVGTPRYMPPDQIRGLPPAPSMDVYSVGLLMAEMLSGQPVVTEEHAAACRRQLSPEPLQLPDPVQASPLGPVIRRAVDKDPVQRFQLAGHFLEALTAAESFPGAGAGELAGTVDAVPLRQLLGEEASSVRADPPRRDPSAPPPPWSEPPIANPGPAAVAAHPHPLMWLSLACGIFGIVLGAVGIALALLR